MQEYGKFTKIKFYDYKIYNGKIYEDKIYNDKIYKDNAIKGFVANRWVQRPCPVVPAPMGSVPPFLWIAGTVSCTVS